VATEPKPDVSKEISRIEKTPEMRAGDRMWSKSLQKFVDITELNQDRARVRMQSGMGSREHDLPKSDLRPRGDVISRSRVGGGGGMVPDTERVPGKKPLKMKKGGLVSASKRADGCCIKGKTKGKMV
jgi:hypothetical protein